MIFSIMVQVGACDDRAFFSFFNSHYHQSTFGKVLINYCLCMSTWVNSICNKHGVILFDTCKASLVTTFNWY